MRLAVWLFPTNDSVPVATLAREIEERGFDGLFVPDHTHIPTSRRTPHRSGGPLPEEYKHVHAPLITLAVAAAATSRLRLGTGVCLAAQRDPILLAKETATLDQISGGRLEFGVGYGWNREEMEHHGIDPSKRRSILREKVLAIREMWTADEPAYAGEFVHFEPSWIWPKPVQDPHPPILIGAPPSPTTFRHVIEFADGWMPTGALDAWQPSGPHEQILKGIVDLRHASDDAGRDPKSIEIRIYRPRPDIQTLEEYARAGVVHTTLGLPSGPPDAIMSTLDGYVELLEQVNQLAP